MYQCSQIEFKPKFMVFLKESYVLIFRKSLWDCLGGKVQNRKVGN
ncbi:hypothetical protein LEP1GSC059_1932 [Leptospira noguchii serovar Panama str. CZ214]|uniref:Uncharacterized protein n=1 Tax=Leptospira noguchii serovar Panama str. CZ214 TaxID=1001595 RepID=T0FKF4_9LEPT|nr:hypothetical protein LEP1GSC059_1932 [Leptospira noguchii serovar Panama str. CZ214]